VLPAVSVAAVKKLEAVGGHSKKDLTKPILQHNGFIYKPFQGVSSGGGQRMRGELEAEFYIKVQSSGHPLGVLLPRFYGVQELDDGEKYLVLEDLTAGFTEACVLDLKMGRRSYDENASPEKVEKERAKYPPQEVVGFRFCGMRVFQPATRRVVESSREWCLSLQPNQIPDALERFFFDGRAVRHDLVRSVLAQVGAVAKCLEERATWRMYGASLLIVYDGASASPNAVVRLIDFSHCYEIKDAGGKDFGFLHGVYFLLAALNDILDRSRRNVWRRGSAVELSTRLINLEESHAGSPVNGQSPPSASLVVLESPLSPLAAQAASPAATKALTNGSSLRELLSRDPHLGPVVEKASAHNVASPLSTSAQLRRTKSMEALLAVPVNASSPTLDTRRLSGGSGHHHRHTSLVPRLSQGRPAVILEEPAPLTFSPRKVKSRAAAAAPVHGPVGGAHGAVSMMVAGEVCKEEVNREQFDVEVAFYRRVAAEGDALQAVMPALLRVEDTVTPRALILEDVSNLVVAPLPAAAGEEAVSDHFICVMDVKLGFRSFKSNLSNEPKAAYYGKYLQFRDELSSARVQQVWASIGVEPTGPESMKKGLLGKRDYLRFRDATTTSSKFGYRLTALRHDEFNISQAESRSVIALDGFVKVLDRFLVGPNGFDEELAAGYIEEVQNLLGKMRQSALFPKYDIVGSSLLLMHCNGVPAVRWIDFGSVSEPAPPDGNGLLEGIQGLLSVLDMLIIRHQL